MSEIAEILGLEGPSLVRIVESLVAEGLISRRVDPSDKRAKLLKLTSKGEGCIPILTELLEQLDQQFLGRFSEEEFGVMLRGMVQLDQILSRDKYVIQ